MRLADERLVVVKIDERPSPQLDIEAFMLNTLSAHGIELAFTTLFGTFGRPFFERYQEMRPIRPGFFKERRDLYNLYPLLVHVRLFGGSYVQSMDRILRHFGF